VKEKSYHRWHGNTSCEEKTSSKASTQHGLQVFATCLGVTSPSSKFVVIWETDYSVPSTRRSGRTELQVAYFRIEIEICLSRSFEFLLVKRMKRFSQILPHVFASRLALSDPGPGILAPNLPGPASFEIHPQSTSNLDSPITQSPREIPHEIR
jgi:hypothetical protein